MAIDYRDQAECLIRARERSDSAGTTEADAFLTDVLKDSAGKDSAGTVFYRPYFVAAVALSVQTYRVERAPEAEFRVTDKLITALLAHQASIDRRYGLTVPPGMEATPEAVSGRSAPRTSMSISTEARF